MKPPIGGKGRQKAESPTSGLFSGAGHRVSMKPAADITACHEAESPNRGAFSLVLTWGQPTISSYGLRVPASRIQPNRLSKSP